MTVTSSKPTAQHHGWEVGNQCFQKAVFELGSGILVVPVVGLPVGKESYITAEPAHSMRRAVGVRNPKNRFAELGIERLTLRLTLLAQRPNACSNAAKIANVLFCHARIISKDSGHVKHCYIFLLPDFG